MPKPLKIVLAVVGVLLVLVIGAVLLAATFFDPNDYRGKITEAVKKETGRDLTLGNIELKVFPWLNVRVADVSFSNAPGFGSTPMAQVREAAVGVQLMPLLLDREVRVSTVKLDGLKLDLAKDASGKTNWDDLIKPDDKPEPEKKDGSKPFDPESIDIAGVTLTDAAINYRDEAAKQSYKLEKVNLETGALQPGEPVDIKASLTATDEVKKMSGELAFSATVLADLVAQKATIDKLKLDVKAKGKDLDASAQLAGDIAANLETQVVSVEGLKLDFKTAMKDLTAEGTLVGKVLADMRTQNVNVDGFKLDFKTAMKDLAAQGSLAAKLKATIDTQKVELAGLSLNANASGAAIPGGKQTLKLTGNAAFDAIKGALRLSDAKIGAAGLNISTSITGEDLMGDAPRLSGPIAIAAFNPRELLKSLGQPDIKTTDATVLSNASLSARYSGSFKSLKLDDLKLKLDDTNAGGTFAVRDFTSQALEFALKVDRLDADRYMPPESNSAAPATPPTKEKSKDLNATEIPLEALEKLNASGTLDVTELKLKGATLKDVRVKIDGPKGAPKQISLDLKAYGGQIATNTRIGPGAKPTYALNTSISALQLAPMLAQFAGKDFVSGLGNIKLDLTTGGKTVGDVRRALNGDVALSFENGAVKGFNLAEIIRRGQALVKGQAYAAPPEAPQTDFTAITFAARVVNGVLKSDQLNAFSPLFRVNGSGEIDLVNETLNYLASPSVVASAAGQGGKGLQDLAGLTIPIKLTGSLFAPKYKLDLQTALKQKAGDELRGKVADKILGGESGQKMSDTEIKAKANEKIGKELGKGLEKLFGGGKKKKTEEPPAEAPASAPAEPEAKASEAPAAEAAPQSEADQAGPATPP
ncbi:MAG: AsmA family protein [Panacagrimonas sp.]